MRIGFKHKLVNSVNADEIAVSRIRHCIKDFAENVLMLGCYDLFVEKEEKAVDKPNYNKNNWKNKAHLSTNNQIQVYHFGFSIEKPEVADLKSPFLIKHKKYTRSILGELYYVNGNVIRIIVRCFANKPRMLNFIQFQSESYKMIDRYFRLSMLSVNVDPKKFEIRGFIECSFKFKSKTCLLEYVTTDIRISELTHNVSIFKGSPTVLSDLLRAKVGPRSNFYENFMITFENNQFQLLSSIKLKQMQRAFPDFPELDKLIRSESFDDYVMVLEMERI